ncbi:transposase, Mutator family protein [Mycobacterium ulcerans str. Harvey]|uniref:Mutator family transposase n=1 Tax=Mycobacterium ulcerans str. Harvey TaxID=1299332 RepID=A0ABP3A7C3_MYCUL|nr:transposase, Mutator family protein [Mycobacterium ulcerans str. Harvey]
MADISFLVCDGLKGLPDSVSAVFPDTVVQTCIIHLIRGTFRYAGASTTPRSPGRSSRSTPRSTLLRRRSLRCLRHRMGHRYPAAIRLWRTPGMSSSHSWTTTRDKEGDLFDQCH